MNEGAKDEKWELAVITYVLSMKFIETKKIKNQYGQW